MALSALSEEDPTFRVSTNEETGQTIIAGMGELHLEILHDRMKREFSVEANVGKPQVSYKETITIPSNSQTKFVKQSGGRGQYAHVELEIEPNEKGKGNRNRQQDRRRRHSKRIHPCRLSKGSKKASPQAFSLAIASSTSKSPSSSVRTTMSTPTKWRLRSADRWPSKKLHAKRKPIILEPIMKVDVTTPEAAMGDVIGDLNRRRGQIIGQENHQRRSHHPRRSSFKRNVWLFDTTALPVLRTCDVCDGAEPL